MSLIKQEYVVGFMFSDTGKSIALIEKNRPEWQKGLLNGIGGKVENNEFPIFAMTREFKEETGYETKPSDWINFVILNDDTYVVHFYYTKNIHVLSKLETKTDEKVSTMYLDYVLNRSKNVIPNLKWLLPLALDSDTLELPIIINNKK